MEKKLKMETKTETLTLPVMHLYHLTADPANDTGYTMEQVTQMLEEHGAEYLVEATITHPVPPPYSVENDIAAHEARITNNQETIANLTTQLLDLEEGTDEYSTIQEQIASIESDITYCEEHIANLQTS
jgi:peptidoglycan hydrolase CwlO-like protein